MSVEPRFVVQVGRSFSWRAALGFAGALCCGAGLAVILWPQVLAYAVGGTFLAFGGMMLLSALAARGRR
ncbi:MAG: hypothetical protein JNM10_16835 [Planctomycetia bacterium]|nr:hypothetical protein [Planctomycetia bacterium]